MPMAPRPMVETRSPWPRVRVCMCMPAFSGSVVVVVGDVLEPAGLRALGDGFEHRQVFHEVVRRGAVPVLLAGWGVDGLSGMHLDDLAAAGLHQRDTGGDVQRLPDRVRVPGRVRAG